MNPLALALGTALGAGVLLVWRGFRVLADRSRDEAARRRGFWPLNAGLLLIAASAFAFTRLSPG